jgi:hypothetical protein
MLAEVEYGFVRDDSWLFLNTNLSGDVQPGAEAVLANLLGMGRPSLRTPHAANSRVDGGRH